MGRCEYKQYWTSTAESRSTYHSVSFGEFLFIVLSHNVKKVEMPVGTQDMICNRILTRCALRFTKRSSRHLELRKLRSLGSEQWPPPPPRSYPLVPILLGQPSKMAATKAKRMNLSSVSQETRSLCRIKQDGPRRDNPGLPMGCCTNRGQSSPMLFMGKSNLLKRFIPRERIGPHRGTPSSSRKNSYDWLTKQ